MQLFVIGPKEAKRAMHAVGLVQSAQGELDGMMATNPPEELVILAVHDLKPGWDQLALQISRRDLRAYDAGRGWFKCTRADAVAAVARAATRCSGPPKKAGRPDFAALTKYLRTVVFGTNQTVFGAIAGGVSPSAVSRWEGGEAEPSLADMSRIREFAVAAGLPWDDRWIFKPPVTDLADAA